MAWLLWCSISSRDTDADDVGPKTSPATGPRGLFGSWVSKVSLVGVVLAVTFSLRPGTEDSPPGALLTEDLAKDCLGLAFDKCLVLKIIVAFALPSKNFCDT